MHSTRIGHLVRSALIGAMAIAALAAGLSVAQQRGLSTFDHLRTSFPLTGIHAVTPCENCHIGGQMAGTPKQCEYCHRPGSRIASTAKPARHIPTTEACDVCHRSAATWIGARFSHVAVIPGTCATCHNGTVVSGKPANHVLTTMSCDACHQKGTAWLPAGFNHAAAGVVVGGGTCGTCHGVSATGKPAGHVSTTASCDSCHRTSAWFPTTFNHTGVAKGGCTTCHGVTATGKPAKHVMTTASCDACHTTGIAWIPAGFNHAAAGIVVGGGTCATCHFVGGSGTAKPAKHVVTTASCDSCHKTTTAWLPALFDHAAAGIVVGGGTCATCHGVTATGKPVKHIPTAAACDTCHKTTTAWLPATFDHAAAGVVVGGGTCLTCHGVAASGKPAVHVLTKSSCDQCHKQTTAWLPAGFNHAAANPPVVVGGGTCATCHGVTATGKPAGHVTTTAACDVCHKSTTAWIPALFDHAAAGIVVGGGTCIKCHGVTATGKTPSPPHPMTSSSCDACHKQTTAWLPVAAFDHAGVVAGTCAKCHGVTATGKPAKHLPTTASCDVCHKVPTPAAPTITWIPATFSHTGVIPGTCATCHNGVSATGKTPSPPHPVTSSSCDACHKATAGTAWLPVSFNHAGVVAGTCATCHGVTATGKPTGHVVTTSSCDACHRTPSPTSTVTWIPASAFNHALVPTAGICATCHNGTNATGKTATHMVTARSCDACHATGTAFLPARHTHTSPVFKQHSSAVTCFLCHKAKTETIAYSFPAYLPNCAACHANKYTRDPHTHYNAPLTKYLVSELTDCSGACHIYASPGGPITKSRTGQHRPSGSF